MKTLGNGHSLAHPILQLRQSIKNLTLLFSLASSLISGMLLSGCAGIPGATDILNAFGKDTQTHSQGEAMTLVKPFEMRIDKTYWKDESLVVDLTISNLGRQSYSFGSVNKVPMFMLQNAQGFEYSSTIDLMTDLAPGAILGRNTMNPGVSIKAKKIFNVPKGEYVMHFSLGTTNGTLFYYGPTLFKWTLNPSVE